MLGAWLYTLSLVSAYVTFVNMFKQLSGSITSVQLCIGILTYFCIYRCIVQCCFVCVHGVCHDEFTASAILPNRFDNTLTIHRVPV